MRFIAAILAACLSMPAIGTEFDSPWKDTSVALVIDPFYSNPIDWEKLATERRVVAVIHKATIGTKSLDPAYMERKEEALKRGYLWGSYHWGVAGNPLQQADFYIDTVKPGPDELIALDLEDAKSKKLMNVDEAIVFIERVKVRTGRYPVLYTNHSSAKLISEKYKGSVFSHTPLWYARFKPKVIDFPTGVWPSYTLWQFSSELLVQIRLPGTKKDLDVNVFNGTPDELKAAWPLTKILP
ncbi:glycosyl hydrolases 25 family protein [Delftia acidovorans]|uniref:glycoside hydrolase family 25 protein n=1 Tax=Delftia acidovorans TaxID=80866 RepID=UPI000506E054|nr:glycoside hydrolase family 25 protein [Delftia acidovorans]KFJ09088.1 glycosyl hydrolases 25 family protein [Delftia acidovorans]QQB51771.1 glycoside hydrolase family 25 protein [Delftia acidovorans]